MKPLSSSHARLGAATSLIALANPAAAHSWIEWASKIAPNGTMVGDLGYARGYVPRNSTDPLFTDSIPVNLLPVSGQSAYSGDEILNKFKYAANPQYPMLEAAAGDYVAIIHLENGHTTLPQNQPLKPRNRGTVYFYGTENPKDEEKLFDVHLLWNKDGTGGDRRGRLLGTRNYDDGQCYQPNAGAISTGRSSRLAPDGASPDQELGCQSDLRLPEDLKAGSVYTIYWYWDWPDLNADHINLEATKNGLYPWAGTFMRGDKDPNGFPMDAIAKNESYSSVMDIKITDESTATFNAKADDLGKDWIADQNIYSMAIRDQMQSNFQVDVDGGSADDEPTTSATAPTSTQTGSGGGQTVTVTKVKTVPPTTVIKTVYQTAPADPQTTEVSSSEPLSTATLIVTMTTTIDGGDDSDTTSSIGSPTSGETIAATSGVRPDVTPISNMKRTNWGFGPH